MKPHQLEAWALGVIDRVRAGAAVEDSLVELKTTWIDAQQAARRIAGHANAAAGQPILWLVGLNEKTGVQGVQLEELADWWAQVRRCFDSNPPKMIVSRNLHVDDKTVCAMLFDADAAPYVVKNSVNNQPGAGPVTREVPWREGTALRSATHEDLIRVLSPLSQMPSVEVVEANLWIEHREEIGGRPLPLHQQRQWRFSMHIYVVPRGEDSIVIPHHRSVVQWQTAGDSTVHTFYDLTFKPFAYFRAHGVLPSNSNIYCTDTEAIISGPGMLSVIGINAGQTDYQPPKKDTAQISARLFVVGLDRELVIPKNLTLQSVTKPGVFQYCGRLPHVLMG
jgi:hypothetical protein